MSAISGRMMRGSGRWPPWSCDRTAVPLTVTLSYNEAARLMDGGEQVDTLPLPPAMVERPGAFVAEF